jgi:ABC-type multidrug transport system fused ATPase/permease subunit
MGANNLMILPGAASSGGVSFGGGSSMTLTPQDADAILNESPAVRGSVPVVRARTQVIYGNRNWVPTFIYGTTPAWLDVREWGLAQGDIFTERDVRNASKVCVLGQRLVRELFQGENPIGKEVRVQNVSFRVEAGETLALVGHTGAGKTSVINLLERFYEPWSGSILVDDLDIRLWDQKQLRTRLGLVMQDVFLFAGDIGENIALGQESLSVEDVQRACRYVHVDEFIQRLPQKYMHQVGEGGTGLSAGQRQLLAFARALAYNPSILLLDEATSNVDPETERLIQDALKRLMHQRTTLVIAHRLSTIQNASKIMVLHHGEIKEGGDHEHLMASKGLYYKLNRLKEANG